MIELHLGDCRAVMATLDPGRIDAIVTDPPYEIGYLNKRWDRTGVAFDPATWETARELLRPGGYLLAFGAPRTYHRLAGAIEEAGFEVRDCLAWLYGNGWPKHKSLLKPAWEPIVMARRPGPTIPLNIDDCRISEDQNSGITDSVINEGRWPANLALDDLAAAELDATSDARPSRFFYSGKAQQGEKDAGLEELPEKMVIGMGRGIHREATRPRRNTHPTVKPVALMRWLIRLVTPVGGLVLDPFLGSGSTGCAAVREGRGIVGIERDPEYLTIARFRINHWSLQGED